jgi:hypothetical protein
MYLHVVVNPKLNVIQRSLVFIKHNLSVNELQNKYVLGS